MKNGNLKPGEKKSLTICAIDSRNPGLAARAIEKTMTNVPHEAAVLFTDKTTETKARIRIIKEIKGIEDYNRFVINNLHNEIETTHALIVQWDGYAISNNWRSEFFEYDYIGAIWEFINDQHRVGNGGFSLRSKKLLKAISEIGRNETPAENEDYYICRSKRGELEEQYGIVFASEYIAGMFSYELKKRTEETLGFHGLWNIGQHEPEDEILDLIENLMPEQVLDARLILLMIRCIHNQKYTAFRMIYDKIRRAGGQDLIEDVLVNKIRLSKGLVKSINKAAGCK